MVLQSRQRRMLGRYFPEIVDAVGQFGTDVVFDGELVLWRRGRFDFGALQERLHPAASRVRELATQMPAAYVVFDLLGHAGLDLRDQPHQQHRAAHEHLLDQRLPAGLVLAPMTTDPAVAHTWLLGHTGSGIEGVVATRRDQPYRPGVHGWQKLRTRLTAEAVVGGVIGSVAAPEALVIGRFDEQGRLWVAGRTTALPPGARVAVGTALEPHEGSGDHPWPETLPSSRFGQRPGKKIAYTRVRPIVVVELNVDTSSEQGRWRHPTRFVRLRPDLTTEDRRAAAVTPIGHRPDASTPDRRMRPGQSGTG